MEGRAKVVVQASAGVKTGGSGVIMDRDPRLSKRTVEGAHTFPPWPRLSRGMRRLSR